jgi:hypothetical protein
MGRLLIKFVTGTKKWLAMVAAQAGLEGKTGMHIAQLSGGYFAFSGGTGGN